MMMSLIDRPAYLLALALTAGAAGVMLKNYGPHTGPLVQARAAQCDAPAARAIEGQIRYDSGLVLRFCSLDAMFAQLGAMEQPGMVRGVYVRAADGRWLAAAGARYGRREQGASPSLLAYADNAAAAGHGRLLSYHELLATCAGGNCSRF
ncbi:MULTISPECIES: hypothetical protein [unclassified Duganella]|uniref:hypothetical protein n=2 Tax=Duganella TaxID=75654 RepID=UPI0018F28A6E|nr:MULTISPECIES: hypothetical protein [unclassified Duganella]